MSVRTRRVLWRFLLFALFGMLMEVFFTGLGTLRPGNYNVHGHSSPWMMIDYGLIGIVLMPIAAPMKRRRIPLVFRAVVYMAAIFAVEFASGWVFDLCGLEIWDYSHLPYNLYGYITATFIPCWYGLGLVLEFLYVRVDAMALAMALGLRANEIEHYVRRAGEESET